MTPGSGINDGPRQVSTRAAHRRPRKRSALTRVVAAGGAVVCIGAAYEVTAPTVHALSIVFHSPATDGTTNETRINILQGNIFDPQLGFLGANVSNNSTGANGTTSTANNFLVNNPLFNNPIIQLIIAILNAEIVIGGAATGPINNSTQISFLSFNIFNPQASIFGGNLSNNTTSANLASGYGNGTNASVTGVPNFWTSWFGGMTGNGNVMQFAFFSGNIFNPQYSIFGPNVSNNTAFTNVSDENGNYSQTAATGGGLLGAIVGLFFGGMTGNGNTTQTAVGTSNITNPQVSIGGSNQSNNTAVTNESTDNGNNSQTTVSGSGTVISTGTTGNGNTSQTAVGTSNIENTQVSIGDVGLSPRPSDLTATQTTSTAPTSSFSVTSTASPSSSSVGTSSVTSSTGSTAPESGGTSTVSAGTTSTTGSTGTSGSTVTSGTTGTSGSSGSADSGGSGGTDGSGGSGGTG